MFGWLKKNEKYIANKIIIHHCKEMIIPFHLIQVNQIEHYRNRRKSMEPHVICLQTFSIKENKLW